MTTLWHNPRCSKSRQALALLEEAGAEVVLRLYLKEAPDLTEIAALQKALGLKAIDMLRKGRKGVQRDRFEQGQPRCRSAHRDVGPSDPDRTPYRGEGWRSGYWQTAGRCSDIALSRYALQGGVFPTQGDAARDKGNEQREP